MKLDEAISALIQLPKKFRDVGNKNFISLLQETGYFGMHNQVSENDIYKVLSKQPSLVKEWMNWSENKRTNEGWYLKESDKGIYVVGWFANNGNTQEAQYSDPIIACAAFIKKEIEEVRKRQHQND